MKKSTRLKLVSAALATTLVPTAHAALYGGGPAENWTIQEIAKQTSTVSGNIASFGVSFATQMQIKFEQLISAIAVATSQEALSASTVVDGTRQAASQLVSAVRAQRVNSAATKAYLDFNPATGQGFDPCGTLAKNKTLDQAFQTASQGAKAVLASLDVAPGRVFVSRDGSPEITARLREHRDKFCTAAEADAGLCTLSELPGGDVNAALLFEPAAPESLKAQARRAYIQNVVGAPVRVPASLKGAGQVGKETMMASVTRQSAMMSIPAYSLAMIDAANTQSPEYGGKSPNEVLSLRVNQYFGGVEAKEWAGSMARQSQRGLLVEHAKMSGLQSWVRQREYEQAQRIEANVAALLVIAADESLQAPMVEHQRGANDGARRDIK